MESFIDRMGRSCLGDGGLGGNPLILSSLNERLYIARMFRHQNPCAHLWGLKTFLDPLVFFLFLTPLFFSLVETTTLQFRC